MRELIAVLIAVSTLAATPQKQTPEGFSCRIGVFTPAERKRHGELGEKLKKAALKQEERPSGYAFQLDPGKLTVLELAEWIDGERRCCPFFDFELELEPHGERLWLKLSGAEGVKAFIKDEMGL